jgi:hypothetical protein
LGSLWPDLLIDVRVRPLRDLHPLEVPLSKWVASPTVPGRLLVVGGPGAGKSTMLRGLVLLDRSRGLPEREFTTARQLAEATSVSDEADVVLVVDGLDELSDAEIERAVSLLGSAPSRPLWMSCRAEFFDRASPAKRFLDTFAQVLEVQPLESADIDGFLARYVARTGATQAVEILNEWRKTEAFAELLAVPLNLILGLFLAEGRRRGPETGEPPTTRFDLYREFYEHWLRYEADRVELSPVDRRWVRNRHLAVARALYQRRQGHRRAHPKAVQGNTPRELVLKLLLRESEVGGRPITEFGHETYMEYLLAADAVEHFRGARSGGIRLDIAFNDDVNVFIREAVSRLSLDEREEVLLRLTQLYESSTDPREREHALYYIGRLDLPYCPRILVDAFEQERHALSRRGAALGAILHGNADLERVFLGELAASSEAQQVNRSVQLVYFGDGFGDLHAFEDRGGAWSRTREAIFSRLARNDVRSERLRWWDLATIMSLFDNRRERPSPQERDVLAQLRLTVATPSVRCNAMVKIIDHLVAVPDE